MSAGTRFLGTFETKMAARNGKFSIFTILVKKKGTVNSPETPQVGASFLGHIPQVKISSHSFIVYNQFSSRPIEETFHVHWSDWV